MSAEVGDTVRFYVGNGGVNLVSSFHVIGEIFDRVYREGDLISPPAEGLQTTLIPAGGAAMIEFKVDFPGNYVLVDHALARVDRGAWGVLHVTGEADPEIFDGAVESGGGH
jgi:nitrite reductase (NO-forming)